MPGAPPGTARTIYVEWGGPEPDPEKLEGSVAVTGAPLYRIDFDTLDRARPGSNYLVLAAKRGPERWRLDTTKITDRELLDLMDDDAWVWTLTWGRS